MKQIFLDLETTGFSRDWDYIIEIAAISYDTETGKINFFHEYIKPDKKIPLKTIELTGITNEQVNCCRKEKEVLMDFNEWAAIEEADVIIGHNCKAFDLDFISKKNDKYKLSNSWIENAKIEDTLVLARELKKQGKIQVENCKQPTLAEYFNINYAAHSAIEDIKALMKIYEKMLSLKIPATRKSLGF